MNVQGWFDEYFADIQSWDGESETNDLPSMRRLLGEAPQVQAAVFMASFDVRCTEDWHETFLQSLRFDLSQLGLPLTAEDFGLLATKVFSNHYDRSYLLDFTIAGLQQAKEQGQFSAQVRRSTLSLLDDFDRTPDDYGHREKAREIVFNLLDRPQRMMLFRGDAWTDAAVDDIESLEPVSRQAWGAIINQAQSASATRPSSKWLKESAALIQKLTQQDFAARLLNWWPHVNRPRREGLPDPWLLNPVNADVLKGLVWMSLLTPSDELTRQVGQVAQAAFKKAPGHGPRAAKVGNACIYVLGQIPGPLALGQLAYLKSRIKHKPALKEIDKALESAARRLNVSREDLEELAVPTYGLTTVGHLEEPLGDFTAELSVVDSGRTALAWRKLDGKLQKSVPASVKAEFAEELKDLKAAAKDIEKMLTAQRQRFDNLFLQEKRWPADVWRERYLDHPLVGVLARRLIWTFKNTGLETSGIWLGDSIVNVDDEPIDWVDADGTTVELWHPIGRPMDDVLAWRHWMERHEVRQPFKQAHREVYILTDAERRTQTYSNRYAAHVLRQHQFNALCAARGWANKLRLMVDADYSAPTRRLENWGLRAEFWVDTIGDSYEVDTTDSGVFRYLSTDQVRFYRLEADRHVAHATGGRYVTEGLDVPLNQPLPLEIIPPIVFSEIMRDVDLFVGVASVGNDPTWSDGGPGGRYREYWQNFSFGDLTPTAQTRKQVLERLVPKLKIGPRCSFNENFLVVRGELRTYKIHLGSGNILMEPNDQYLCIVPDSSAVTKGDSVFLPFEGDRTLSIILSKAMLLSDDRKITDPTITRQIQLA
jgi:hypothetical protein